MYLGIDLGTSGVKALLMDADQRVVGSATMPLGVRRPHPGWSEQDPADWIAAAQGAIAQLARDHGLAGLRGIGLSGQMHGAVTLDAQDRVLRPAILWNDTRAHLEAAQLDAMPVMRHLSGNIVFPGFTAPKLVWMARHEPDLHDRVASVLLPKDYLRLWLTGGHVSEMSDASGTSWLDVGRRDWSDDLLAASGMRRDQMPALVEGSAPSGMLRDALAREWGVDGPVTVAGGAGDNAATAIGAGTVGAGQGFVSLGTSGVLFAATDRFLPAPETAVHAFCHAAPGMWHHMGVILQAAAALEWLSGVTGIRPAELTRDLGPQAAPGPEIFLPYLSGERTPHNDAQVRGLLAGLGASSGPQALTRAVLDGVAFALADNLHALRQAGAGPDALLALGGGARSDYWLRSIANALDLPVLLPEGGDYGAAFGAARLGLMADTGAGPEICLPPAIAAEIAPDPALVPAYAEGLARFRALYPAARS
ncbi:xylulokinase [Paracoccus sp. 1_MG-2023]|uniref:xylulokinase n=1 Tax=unclassified Paracoccus (in: a-proteobacteria) TaxID=2688777 RepID=UPI001C07F3F9|nr:MULTISPECIES: xylulokinase [unclassified Paracoccus (in: a-proteobacteria)]MBU2958323.1 xylulokinase [Paracoccus sp. C2R09]MDO6668450.1 xylulokinase [Paracoccus sp. 1_MG-2023]